MMRTRLLTCLLFATLSASVSAQDIPLDACDPVKPWPSHGTAIVNTVELAGGPQGQPCRVFTYQDGNTTFMNFAPTTPLRPGTKLAYRIKGNGTKDTLSLYLHGGDGHRGWGLDLSGTEWKEVVVDLTFNWDREDSGRGEGRPTLDITKLTGLSIHVNGAVTPHAAPFRLADLRLIPPPEQRKPAVLFLATYFLGNGLKEISVAEELRKAGFAVAAHQFDERGSGRYTFRDELAQFNVVVLLAAVPLGADGRYDAHNQRLVDDLRWFVDKGGGIFFTPTGEYFGKAAEASNKFLSLWGGAEVLDEQIVDASTETLAPTYSYPFSYTANIAASPLAEGVRGIWYPSQTFGPGSRMTAPVRFGPEWQILLKGAKTASTVGGKPYEDKPATSFPSEPPMMGIRQAGAGRLAFLQMSPSVHFVGGLHPAWSGVTWNKGIGDRASDFGRLALNTLTWLAEPNVASRALGGYQEPPTVVEKPVPPKPIDWATAKFPEPLATRKTYRGLLGAVSTYGGGASTVAEYAAAAKAAGLNFLLFSDPLEKMDAATWGKLTADCAAATSASLVVLPGLQYLDRPGNHYLLYGNFAWPKPEMIAEVLTPDRARVRDTYKWGSAIDFRTTILHTLAKNPNRVLDLRHYGAIAAQTWTNGKLSDDAYQDYLLLQENLQYPAISAVHFMKSAGEVAAAAKTGLQLCVWANDNAGLRKLLDSSWMGNYFANPHPYYLSSGPVLDDWVELNMNSWRPDAPGTDRWKARVRLSGASPITELNVMDGRKPYRTFRPNAAKVEQILEGLQGPQRQLTLRVRDAAGGELISSQLKSHTMVHMAFSCSDRQNWLGEGTMGYKLWPAYWGMSVNVSNLETYFPPLWDGTGAAHGGMATVGVEPTDGSAGDEGNGARQGATRRLLFASRDCTVTEQITDQVYQPEGQWGDCQPTPPTRPAQFLRQRLLTTHYRQYDDSPGFLLIDGEFKVRKEFTNKAPRFGCLEFRNSEKSTPGSLVNATYPDGFGRQIVRHVPPGTGRTNGGITPMKPGDYVARYPRTLGAPALFGLSGNLLCRVEYLDSNAFAASFHVPVESTQIHAGQSFSFRALGMMSLAPLAVGNADFETARRTFGLDNGTPGYTVACARGAVRSQQYECRLTAKDGSLVADFSALDYPAPLPVVVEGLDDRLPGILYDRASKEVRRFTVFEGKGYLAVDAKSPRRVFIGSPITISAPELVADISDHQPGTLTLEVHNPTAAPVTVTLTCAPEFSLAPNQPANVTVPAGLSTTVKLRSNK